MSALIRSLIVVVAVTFFVSCKKDEAIVQKSTLTTTSEESSILHYYPLEVGNYWVYDVLTVYPSSSSTTLHRQDSVVVTNLAKDSIGNVMCTLDYFQIRKNNVRLDESKTFYTSDNVLYDAGLVVLSKESDTFNYATNPNFTVNITNFSYRKIGNNEFTVNGKKYEDIIEIETAYKLERSDTTYWKYESKVFAKDVGLVYTSQPFVLLTDAHIESRLIRHSLE